MSNITPLFPLHVFIACCLSKSYLQSERKGWFYLAQILRFSVPKTFKFLFRKNVSWKYFFPQISIFVKSLKHKHKDERFHRCFSIFFLLFRNTYIKEYFWVAASIYFNRELHKNVKIRDLWEVIIFWREYLFNSK